MVLFEAENKRYSLPFHHTEDTPLIAQGISAHMQTCAVYTEGLDPLTQQDN